MTNDEMIAILDSLIRLIETGATSSPEIIEKLEALLTEMEQEVERRRQ